MMRILPVKLMVNELGNDSAKILGQKRNKFSYQSTAVRCKGPEMLKISLSEVVVSCFPIFLSFCHTMEEKSLNKKTRQNFQQKICI